MVVFVDLPLGVCENPLRIGSGMELLSVTGDLFGVVAGQITLQPALVWQNIYFPAIHAHGQ